MKQKWLLPDKSTLNTHIHRKSLWSSCLCIHIELYFFFSLWKFVMFNLHKYRSIKKVKELMFKSFVCSYYNKNANMSDFRIHTIATPPPLLPLTNWAPYIHHFYQEHSLSMFSYFFLLWFVCSSCLFTWYWTHEIQIFSQFVDITYAERTTLKSAYNDILLNHSCSI